MEHTKNVFITDDIRIEHIQFYGNDVENWDLTENIDDFLRCVGNDEGATILSKKEAAELLERFEEAIKSQNDDALSSAVEDIREWIGDHDTLYGNWRDDLTTEQYQMPMMNAVRWFPDFVDFEEWERYKVSGATYLIYDNENGRWGVAMSGGGMDLAPHLLDTFIQLGKGIPAELTESIRADYNAYVNAERHRENCNKLAKAYLNQSGRVIQRIADLWRPIKKTGERDASKTINDIVKRHILGLEKALKEYVK